MLKKILLATLLCVASTNIAFASTNCSLAISNIAGLEETTKQRMIIDCEKAKLQQQTTPQAPSVDNTLEKMDKWSEISLRFAKALGVAAKEFGVAVNDFLYTPAGKLTALFIAWQLAGHAMVYVLLAMLALALTCFTTSRFRKVLTLHSTEEVSTKNIFGNDINKKVPVYKGWKELEESAAFFVVVSYFIDFIVIISILLSF